jgi:hypothetical protein
MRRVEFYEGEADQPADDNMVGKLADRGAHRPTRAQIQTAVDEVGADYPLLVRGADPSHSGTGTRTITLTHGVWCAAEDNPPAAASDAPEVYFGDSTGAAYTLDANTSGAVYRRDILQVWIDAESTIGSESRDFEDAATRALSTQSFNKRRVRTVTISVKKGSDQASEALADANEPAADAGYVKIFSFLVDNAGACAAAKRKRYTIGYRIRRTTPQWHGAAGGGTGATVNVGTGRVDPSGAGSWLIPLSGLSVGDRIDELTLLGSDLGGSLTLSLVKIDGADGSRDVVDGPSPSSGGWGAGLATLAPAHEVLADHNYFAEVTYDSSPPTFSGVKGSIRHPS